MYGPRMAGQLNGHRVGAGVQTVDIEPTDPVGDCHRDDDRSLAAV